MSYSNKTASIVSFIGLSIALTIPAASAAELMPMDAELISGDIPITKQMYLDRMAIMTLEDQRIARYSPQQARKLINDMYRRVKLVEEAERQKLHQDDLVKKKVAYMRDQEIITALQEKVRNSLVPPSFDEAAEEHYIVNKEKFMLPERRAARHILLKGPDAEKQAREMIANIAAGADFGKLAKQHSQDASSAKESGDLGKIARGKTVQEFEQALFSLQKPGDVSDAVVTKFGVHVIQLTEILPAGARPFEEVKSGIASVLREQWVKTKMLEWYESLTKPVNAKSHEARIDALLAELSQAAKSENDDSGK